MEHGIITNWNDMQQIWEYIYGPNQLNVIKIVLILFENQSFSANRQITQFCCLKHL